MRIAITGHRPDKLGGFDAQNPIRVDLRRRFKDVLISLAASSWPEHTEVYVGSALGFDTDAARVCVEAAVPFIAAVPFPSQYRRWRPDDQKVYHNMLTYAKRVEYVSSVDPPESVGVNFAVINMMYARNRYMVDRCDLVVAAWDGSPGGTAHCVKYAQSKGKEILVLTPERANSFGDVGSRPLYYINPQPTSRTL